MRGALPLVRIRVGILPKFKSDNAAVMDFGRTVGKTQRANAGTGLGEARIVADAAAPWVALSMIFSAMFGAATLTLAISSCVVLLPTLAIMSAALRHRSRVISMSVRGPRQCAAPRSKLDDRLAERGAG